MRTALLPVLLVLATASVASATDIDFKAGLRSFGPDGERWPEVGFGVRFGPDAWRVKPAVGAAVASDLIYAGTVIEGSAGVGGDLPHLGRAAASWGLGLAYLDYDLGANQGSAEAAYLEFGLRWVRPEEGDFGINVRYLDGSDITFHYSDDPFAGGENSFSESISTVVVSFLVRW